MKKAFTLIELIVSISILAVIAVAAIPPLLEHQKRAKLEETTTQLKDAILSTQNYAMAPGAVDIDHYSLIINTSGSPVSYYPPGSTIPVPARSYQLYSFSKSDPPQGVAVSNGNLPEKVTISNNLSLGDPFIISYRTKDGAVGFNSSYYDSPGWMWTGDPYFIITLTESGQTRIIKIQNTTGAISVGIP